MQSERFGRSVEGKTPAQAGLGRATLQVASQFSVVPQRNARRRPGDCFHKFCSARRIAVTELLMGCGAFFVDATVGVRTPSLLECKRRSEVGIVVAKNA